MQKRTSGSTGAVTWRDTRLSTEHVAFGDRGRLPWIEVASRAPYFVTQHGHAWTPIGHNDAITWPALQPLWRSRDVARVEAHVRDLVANGVTVLRLMLECSQNQHRFLERAAGRFNPHVVSFWDQLVQICERTGMRLMLTPFDTYWMWIKWRHHPYNSANGGPIGSPSTMLVSKEARQAIKVRLTFAIERWGGSGAIFAWDLWNEIHVAQAEGRADGFVEFIADVSEHVRRLEQRLYGRTHLQTVSIFGPELTDRPGLGLEEAIFRHPHLDFASIHTYAHGTIDDPADTVAPAVDMARIVRASIAEIRDRRPFLDTEHGPIHKYKDKHRTLPAPFDDEYFRHLQWAHLAAGGAGGGMRWPNRNPHVLTAGMHAAQRALHDFLPSIDWTTFYRRPHAVTTTAPERVHAIACADETQAVAWLVRRDTLGADGRLDAGAPALHVVARLSGLAPGDYRVTCWDTRAGRPGWQSLVAVASDGHLAVTLDLISDLALGIGRAA